MSTIYKLITVVGPTASGKSDLAVDIALKFNGEIVSADSRQVYKGLDIGTGKIMSDEMRGVKHYLLDVADPNEVFTVANYKEMAEEAVRQIFKDKKLPILCGGTGLYIKSIVDNTLFPKVPPDEKLRNKLSNQSKERLFQELTSLDPARASNIDAQNPRRLIRAIEIAMALGVVPPIQEVENNLWKSLQIGIKIDDKTLKQNIHARLLRRLSEGMAKEAENLHDSGLSYQRMENLGLEYRYLARFLKGEITEENMVDSLEREIWKYAKRQKTWFKKDKRIKWFSLKDKEAVYKEVNLHIR